MSNTVKLIHIALSVAGSAREVEAHLRPFYLAHCVYNKAGGHFISASIIPDFPLEGAMIAQRFEFTKYFSKKRHTGMYDRLRKILCKFKDQARVRRPMENLGLPETPYNSVTR